MKSQCQKKPQYPLAIVPGSPPCGGEPPCCLPPIAPKFSKGAGELGGEKPPYIGGRFTILPPTISTIFGPRSLPPMGGRQLPPIAIWGEGIFMFNRWGGATENLPPIMGGSNLCRWGWGGDSPAMRGRLFHVRFRWGGEKCGRGEIQKSAPPPKWGGYQELWFHREGTDFEYQYY